MIYAFAGGVVILLAYAVVRILMTAEPAHLARLVRYGGPILFGLVGTALLALGKGALGGLSYALALATYALAYRRPKLPPVDRARQSTVRSAALDMRLDHATGALDGLVLAGRHEQRTLSAMQLPQLLELYEDCNGDSESRQLLEAYLDGRFPVWRAHGKANGHAGQGVAPGTGAMTEQEAYKVLGLEAGASAAEIRKAHRRLIESLNPHVARASTLALRIDRAKDILIAKHG